MLLIFLLSFTLCILDLSENDQNIPSIYLFFKQLHLAFPLVLTSVARSANNNIKSFKNALGDRQRHLSAFNVNSP